mgnify:CR=1 FL=1
MVALVITIILLLILAGISIQTLAKTNLFNQAKQAKNATENAQKEENKILSEYIDKTNEYLPETLAYKVNSGEVAIGSYIKYEPDEVSEETINNLITELGTYSGSNENTKSTLAQEKLSWRVLDVKDGQVRLISEVPTTSPITLFGYNGYNNAVKLLDDTCSTLYNNSKLANKAQNLKIEDVQDKMKEKDNTKINSNYGQRFTPDNKYYPSLLLKEKEQKDPLEVFEAALNNVMPVLEVKARRIGGATYQVPIEIRPERRQTLGLRWLVIYARKRHEKTMAEKLAGEIMDAVAGNGGAF